MKYGVIMLIKINDNLAREYVKQQLECGGDFCNICCNVRYKDIIQSHFVTVLDGIKSILTLDDFENGYNASIKTRNKWMFGDITDYLHSGGRIIMEDFTRSPDWDVPHNWPLLNVKRIFRDKIYYLLSRNEINLIEKAITEADECWILNIFFLSGDFVIPINMDENIVQKIADSIERIAVIAFDGCSFVYGSLDDY